MADGVDLRIGDADREAAAASLREHFAEGRLSLDEFNERIDAVFAATRQSQLRRVSSDLPHAAIPSTPVPVAAPQRSWDQGDWHYSRHRPRLRLLTTLAAILISWLVYADLVSPDLRHFPAIGRLGIVLAIFLVLRRLLRGLIGWPGGGRRRYGSGCRYSGWHDSTRL
jgi:Domain of unknown function (DUF1707)